MRLVNVLDQMTDSQAVFIEFLARSDGWIEVPPPNDGYRNLTEWQRTVLLGGEILWRFVEQQGVKYRLRPEARAFVSALGKL